MTSTQASQLKYIYDKVDTLIKFDTKELLAPFPFSYNFIHEGHATQVWGRLNGSITVGDEIIEVSMDTSGYNTSKEKVLIFDNGVTLTAKLYRDRTGSGTENNSKFEIKITDNLEQILLPTNSVLTTTSNIQSSGLIISTRLGHCFIREQ